MNDDKTNAENINAGGLPARDEAPTSAPDGGKDNGLKSQNDNTENTGEPVRKATLDRHDKEEDKPVPALSLPKYSIVLFIIAGASALVYAAATVWPAFADFFSRYPGSAVRAALAYLTNWIPFSFSEFLLLFLPVIIFYLIRLAVKKYSGSWRNTAVYVGILFSLASVFFSVFVLGFGTGYHGSTLDKKLGLDRQDVSAEDLYYTASLLADKVNEESENVAFVYHDFSVMPYSIGEMNDKLIDAYDKVCDEYSFVQRLSSRVKPVMLSEAMSYTHITGVYTYFTGEANINVAFPDYTIPFTAAHELAHQRGIAREDEANFIAFLVCIASDDPYIRYSGYLNMYEYVSSSLYSADSTLYSSVAGSLYPEVRFELVAYSAFYEKYRTSKAAEVSHAINDTYLKMQGTEGTRSYGMVTDLAVAYYKVNS